PADGFSVGGRLRLKETPGGLILLQQPIVRFFQVHASLLVGVDARFVLFSGLIGFEAGWLHLSLFDERLSTFDIDAAPDTAGFAWREANGVAEIVDTLPNTIYPAVAECFVNRLGPSNAWLARAFLVVADPQCISLGMMPLQPLAESRRRLKESWFHAHLETQASRSLGKRRTT